MLRLNLRPLRGAVTPRSVLPSPRESWNLLWSLRLHEQQRREARTGAHWRRASGGGGHENVVDIDSFAPSATTAAAAAVEYLNNLDNDDDEEEEESAPIGIEDALDDEDDDDDGEAYDDNLPFIPLDEIEREAFDDLDVDPEIEEEEAPAAGPRCLVLAGLLEGEAAAARALADRAGFSDVAVFPAEGADALSLTVRDAVLGGALSEPNWALPRQPQTSSSTALSQGGGGGVPVRAVIFGGLTPREQARLLDAFEGAGIPRLAVAEADALDWAERRVGDVLAQAAAEQGLLPGVASAAQAQGGRQGGAVNSSGSGSSSSGGSGGRGAGAPSSGADSSPTPAASARQRPFEVFDELPDVEEAIRVAERASGGGIRAVEAGRPPPRGEGRDGAAASAEADSGQPQAPPPPTWHAEVTAAGPSLLDSMRDNVEAKEADDDLEDEEEEEEEAATLLDSLVSKETSKNSASSSEEVEEIDFLEAYMKAVTAADVGPLPDTDSSPVFRTKTPAEGEEGEEEEEDKRKQKQQQMQQQQTKSKEKAAGSPSKAPPRASAAGFGGGRSSGGKKEKKKEEEKRAEEEIDEEQEEEQTAPQTPPPSSSSNSDPARPEPITIAPVGLDPEEIILHDRITEDLDAQFKAMPASDKEALRERMREEAREPTKDAVVAAVACGLTYEEICAMARVAYDAAHEAEEELGVRWAEMAKTRLEPSEEELRLARERAADREGEEFEEDEEEEEVEEGE